MTPVEKALEIRNSFIDLTKAFHPEDGWIKDLDSAKKAAIINVNNIISELQQLDKPEYTIFITCYDPISTDTGYGKIDFWNDVINELENL